MKNLIAFLKELENFAVSAGDEVEWEESGWRLLGLCNTLRKLIEGTARGWKMEVMAVVRSLESDWVMGRPSWAVDVVSGVIFW